MENIEIIEDVNGKTWYLNGLLHREDGPAYEGVDGSKEWWLNDKLHRTDGPAVEWAIGDKEWYLNGKRHRIDGPAYECVSGDKSWYLNGEELSEEEWQAIVFKVSFDGIFPLLTEKEELCL